MALSSKLVTPIVLRPGFAFDVQAPKNVPLERHDTIANFYAKRFLFSDYLRFVAVYTQSLGGTVRPRIQAYDFLRADFYNQLQALGLQALALHPSALQGLRNPHRLAARLSKAFDRLHKQSLIFPFDYHDLVTLVGSLKDIRDSDRALYLKNLDEMSLGAKRWSTFGLVSQQFQSDDFLLTLQSHWSFQFRFNGSSIEIDEGVPPAVTIDSLNALNQITLTLTSEWLPGDGGLLKNQALAARQMLLIDSLFKNMGRRPIRVVNR
jgi:hypothetical protein